MSAYLIKSVLNKFNVVNWHAIKSPLTVLRHGLMLGGIPPASLSEGCTGQRWQRLVDAEWQSYLSLSSRHDGLAVGLWLVNYSRYGHPSNTRPPMGPVTPKGRPLVVHWASAVGPRSFGHGMDQLHHGCGSGYVHCVDKSIQPSNQPEREHSYDTTSMVIR